MKHFCLPLCAVLLSSIVLTGCTDEEIAAYPQIVPAKGETDTGVVVSFDCEDGSVTDSMLR